MIDDAADDGPRPLPPVQRMQQIEVDTFCAGCHYNLHGQAVTVDDRLNIPVCRCPECGRFHPAGVGVTASNVWLRRLATTLMFNWIAIVLAGALATCFFMGLLATGSVEVYGERVLVGPDGQPANPKATSWRYATLLHPVLGGPAVTDARFDVANPYNFGSSPATAAYPALHEDGPGPTPWLWMAAGSVALGALGSGLCVTLLWHWPKRRYLWCLLLPTLAAAVVSGVYRTEEQYQLVRGLAIARLWGMAGVQGLGILVGIVIGRPIARAVVRTVIPPKPRQALAFLWRVDAKTLPG